MTNSGNAKTGNKGSENKNSGKSKTDRNKKTDSEGRPYENRDGKWTALNRAVYQNGLSLESWLTKERCETELSILNYPGKYGPKFKYPPSLIKFLCLLKEDRNHSYRRATANMLLVNMGLENPDHTTLHKNEKRYFDGEFGYHVMAEACVVLVSQGAEGSFDPCTLVGTGVCPDYKAPQITVDSSVKQTLQENMDAEAERMKQMMEVMCFKDVIDGDEVHIAAVDGSGVGISGPGIYFEYIWKVNNRRFIKQHVVIDVRSKKVLSFSITMESPGDAAVFVPLMEGTVKAGIRIGRVYADSAYDTIANWVITKNDDIEFCPNLKKNFGENHDLPERNGQKAKEEELGKKAFHLLTGYNIRWLVEVFFSVIKKLYGEKVRNRNFDRMVLTMRWRYDLYMIRQDYICKAREGSLVKHE